MLTAHPDEAEGNHIEVREAKLNSGESFKSLNNTAQQPRLDPSATTFHSP
jgi:hypothetical protein